MWAGGIELLEVPASARGRRASIVRRAHSASELRFDAPPAFRFEPFEAASAPSVRRVLGDLPEGTAGKGAAREAAVSTSRGSVTEHAGNGLSSPAVERARTAAHVRRRERRSVRSAPAAAMGGL